LLTLIWFLSSFMYFKKTEICECFTIFPTSLMFIYTINSFRCLKVTRTNEGFPHCLHPLDFSPV
jgi:hypothetical protein